MDEEPDDEPDDEPDEEPFAEPDDDPFDEDVLDDVVELDDESDFAGVLLPVDFSEPEERESVR
ncbi:hypothetical protein [Micromonospora sp. URMC 103]|uniref:hypothetical protein n=1 Tax=Micromonospora sp. URMC 103 TaxID=3423406 RepID=UPI003F1CB735